MTAAHGSVATHAATTGAGDAPCDRDARREQPTRSDRIVDSPLGLLHLTATPYAVVALRFAAAGQPTDAPAPASRPLPSRTSPADTLLKRMADQLAEYFAGDRTDFDVPVHTDGTPFQREVWARLRAIPFGTTTTYGALAAAIGRPRATRAVAAAIGRNPVAIVVPCHRVIGADGTLTGFSGGLHRKRALLDIEGIATA